MYDKLRNLKPSNTAKAGLMARAMAIKKAKNYVAQAKTNAKKRLM